MRAVRASFGAAGRLFSRPAVTRLFGQRRRGAGPRSAPRTASLVLAVLAACSALPAAGLRSAAAQTESDTPPPPSPTPAPGSEPEAAQAPQQPLPPPEAEPADEEPPAAAPEWVPEASYEAPAAPSSAASPSGNEASPDAGTSDAGGQPAGAGAINVNTIFQAIWQVQVGCRSNCTGTTQTQSAAQGSTTEQHAVADSDDGVAAAVNQSSTVQFIWQAQLGCAAFCWHTSMNQSATQTADTTQTAVAIGSLTALALNVAETFQYVWQYQEGCEVECHDTAASQSVAQGSSTSQSAAAEGSQSSGLAFAGPDDFFSWVTNLAASFGATVQTISQQQEADCLEHCGPETQEQAAEQHAAAIQSAAARPQQDPVAEAPPEPLPSPADAQAPSAGHATVAQAADAQGRVDAGTPSRPSRRKTAAPEAGNAAPRGSVAGSASPATAPAAGRTSQGSAATAPDRSSAGSAASEIVPASAPSMPGAPDQPTAAMSERGPSGPWLPVSLLAVAAAASIFALRAPRKLNT